jgi:hypothetical protein
VKKDHNYARSVTHLNPASRIIMMFRYIAVLALVGSASATDVSAHARLSEIGKGLVSALSRIEPADDFSNAGRSLLELDASFCGVMTTQLSCGIVPSASCASTTGCALESGSCGVDQTQFDSAEFESLFADPNFVALGEMASSCFAKSANQCSADITCNNDDGSCDSEGVYTLFWTYDKCPTTAMTTAIVDWMVADGVTQAQVQEEADATGFTISPELQTEMDARGVSSSANAAAPAMVILSTLIASLAIFA